LKLGVSTVAVLAVALIVSGSAFAKATTNSLYESDAKRPRLALQGCAAARRHERGVVILDFGKPSYAHHAYGTIDFSGRFISNHTITMGMYAWARGYVNCLPRRSRAHVTLARGTSNYHPYGPSVWVAGKRWAGAVLSLETRLNRHGFTKHVASAAAIDAEPAWDRSFSGTKLFIQGYRKFALGRTLYDYGSLDGGVGSIWSARQMMLVTGGQGHTAVLPEIYYASQAREWAQLAYVAHHWFHRRMHFAGVMTQGTSTCRHCGFRPPDAHKALVDALTGVDTGAPLRVPRGGTNIVWG
jgi:hypothetical protein